MQFDTLNNRLFDLAKKGTRDPDFTAAIFSDEEAVLKGPRPRFFERKKIIAVPASARTIRQRPARNLKQLQFNLFD